MNEPYGVDASAAFDMVRNLFGSLTVTPHIRNCRCKLRSPPFVQLVLRS